MGHFQCIKVINIGLERASVLCTDSVASLTGRVEFWGLQITCWLHFSNSLKGTYFALSNKKNAD